MQFVEYAACAVRKRAMQVVADTLEASLAEKRLAGRVRAKRVTALQRAAAGTRHQAVVVGPSSYKFRVRAGSARGRAAAKWLESDCTVTVAFRATWVPGAFASDHASAINGVHAHETHTMCFQNDLKLWLCAVCRHYGAAVYQRPLVRACTAILTIACGAQLERIRMGR